MQTIQEWIERDKKLSDILVEIQSLKKTELQQAEIAFDQYVKFIICQNIRKI